MADAEIVVRRTQVVIDDKRVEIARVLSPPIRRVVAAAVLSNPFVDHYVEDLDPLIEVSKELAAELAGRAVSLLDGREVHSYGKGVIVGTGGELEHAAALMHPALGAPLREACGGGKSIIPSAKKRGGPGCTLDIPLHHRTAAFVRSHFDAVELRVPDGPTADELVLAVAVTDGGRPLPRVGGLTVDEIVGEDGLR
ncbi:MAG: amino acid synthesis family protein [Acidimicrobiales bacterium]